MIVFDDKKNYVAEIDDNGKEIAKHALTTPEAFELINRAWRRVSRDVKYIYAFSWMGRPFIQLPEDVLRIQEVIWEHKPDVFIETGVAHGGSLVFYSTLFKAMEKGRVIGVELELTITRHEARVAHLGEAHGKAMREPDGQGHVVVVVAAGVAEHHSLIAGAERVQHVFATGAGSLLEGRVDAVGDIGALLVERDEDATTATVEAHRAVVVADADDRLAREGVDVDVGAG